MKMRVRLFTGLLRWHNCRLKQTLVYTFFSIYVTEYCSQHTSEQGTGTQILLQEQ